eukprot:m.143273 g.143273  ORF g.143273 m.143273 type:complete len:285 (+) comp30306_c1_seq2:218-1072(+)
MTMHDITGTNIKAANARWKMYMICYNLLLGIGWIWVLCSIVYDVIVTKGLRVTLSSTWKLHGALVWKLQSLVVLDVVHAGLGWWPSDPNVGLLQRLWCKVGHRLEIFITIFLLGDATMIGIGVPVGLMVFTWALADVFRYPRYLLRTLDIQPPYLLTWLRYSDFILQWPLNVFAEGWFVVCAVECFALAAHDKDFHLHLGPLTIDFMSYAPIAIGFQGYEWVIFIPGYLTLWRVRQRRLGNHQQSSTVDTAPENVRCTLIAAHNQNHQQQQKQEQQRKTKTKTT